MALIVPPLELDIDLIPGAVKTATKEAGAKGSDLWMVPVAAITVMEGFNVRVTGTAAYDKGIADLKHSMMSEGFYRDKPLTGYVGKAADSSNTIFLTDGHRRYQALQAALADGLDVELVPVLIKPQGTDMVDLTVALTKTGEPLTPYEMAIVVKRLISLGKLPEEIATRLGFTKRYIDDLLLLISAPAKVRNLVMQGKVSATLAIKELRADVTSAGETLGEAADVAEKTGKKRVTNKDVKKTKAKAESKTKKAEKAGPDTDALKLEYAFVGKAGDIFDLKDAAMFTGVAQGSWYELTENEGEIKVLQDIKMSLKMSRKPMPANVADEAADL